MTHHKKILYLDCPSGISGDMFLGSLIDCGLDIRRLASQLRKIKIGVYKLAARKVSRAGVSGVKFDVIYKKHRGHEHTDDKTFKGIVKAINSSGLSSRVKETSVAVFTNLAKAESRAHGIPVGKVHFHEVGDIDSVVDIVGACVALEEMGIDEVYSSRLTVANPAPATAYLLQGIDISVAVSPFELATPTGAALLKTFSRSQIDIPAMKVLRAGFGAGSREIPGRPNLLKAIIGERRTNGDADIVTVLETNIDDMNTQVYGYLIDRLFEAGALDVYITPAIMKKSRPACVLTVLSGPSTAGVLSGIIFEETSTFGIRRHNAERLKLERKIVEVKTKYGNIKVKAGFYKDSLNICSPEYEDCKRIAGLKKVPFSAVRREAEAAARRNIKGEKRGFA
ncbi:MAG: nickel pincer cofactor biosynthesis protein LarC [Candidatus Omnitrophica bacterium]|nr:nickel pincer cofactor biosynthesis protein LarC [Candidatus Omnitrophota bacterium]